jgi:hypothetical protein
MGIVAETLEFFVEELETFIQQSQQFGCNG